MTNLILNLRRYYSGELDTKGSEDLQQSKSKIPDKIIYDYYEKFTDWIVEDQSLIDKSDLTLFMDTDAIWEETELEFLEAHFNNTTSQGINSIIENRMRYDKEFLKFYVVQESIYFARKAKGNKSTKREVPAVEAQLEEEGFFENIKKELVQHEPATGQGASDVIIKPKSAGKVVNLKRRLTIAAAAAVAAGLGVTLFKDLLTPFKSNEELFTNFSSNDLLKDYNNTSFLKQEGNIRNAAGVGNNTTNTILLKAMGEYRQGNYPVVLNTLGETEDARADHLRALSQYQLKDYSSAQQIFEKLFDTVKEDKFIEVSTLWHLALLYIKDGKQEKAKELLKDIKTDRYEGLGTYQENAEKLLNELK